MNETLNRRAFIGGCAAGIGGATVGPMPVTAETPRRWGEPSAEDIKRWRRANYTESAARLNIIVRHINRLRGEIAEWLDEHGQDCECGFCSAGHRDEPDGQDPNGPRFEYDLRGLSWILEQSGIIESCLARLDDEELSRLAKRYGLDV